jgi:glucokinase
LDGTHVIGVDLGGTKILAGVIDAGGRVHETVQHPTPTDSQEKLLDALVGAVGELRGGGAQAVGFGIPSQIDQRTGTTGRAVNIPLADIPFRSVMEQRLGLPVALDNDANVAALAESRVGVARDVETMVMLTLGTGVGGGIVLDGQLYRGWAELGHIVVQEDGPPCGGTCTGRGHLEALCSGNAADALAAEVLGPGSTARDLVAQRHEALAIIGHHLGSGIGTLVNIFNPEQIVIGGGFGTAAFELLLPSAREIVRREALWPAGDVPIVVAALGKDAGLIGAGLLALELAA